MRRNCRMGLGIALVTAVCTPPLSAQYNPRGWIQTRGWNLLFTFRNEEGCTGGGEEKMKENWVAPHRIELEDPKAGDLWADIDFAVSASSGWGGPTAQPRWVSNRFLESTFGLAAGSVPNADIVDFKALVDFANAAIKPPAPSPTDDVLGIATTYIENKTGGALEVDICASSDDSLQAWVNNKCVINHSVCRPTSSSCDDTARVILPAGVSKIAVLVWQGEDEWSFRLGILRASGGKYDDKDDRDLGFLGAGDSDNENFSGQVQYCVDRQEQVDCCGDGGVRVRLRGKGDDRPDTVTVVEEIRAVVPESLEITDPGGGEVSPLLEEGVLVGRSIRWPNRNTALLNGPGLRYTFRYNTPGVTIHAGTVVGHSTVGGTATIPSGGGGTIGSASVAFEDFRDIGSPPFPGKTSYDASTDTYTMVGSGVDIGEVGDEFHFAFKCIVGDFAIGARITERVPPSNGQGEHGLMARWTCDAASKFSMVQTDAGPPPGATEIQSPRHAFRVRHLSTAPVREYYVIEDGLFESRQPPWMCLIRIGNTIYTYLSDADGHGNPLRWCLVGSDSDPEMPEELLVGMALTSNSSTERASISFDNVFCTSLQGCADFEPLDFETSSGALPYEPRFVEARIGGLALKNRVIRWTDLEVGSENLVGTQQLFWNAENSNYPDVHLEMRFRRQARVYIAWDRRHVPGGSDNPDGTVDNGWFDLTNPAGTYNRQGWLRLNESIDVDPSVDTIENDEVDSLGTGGVWCRDFASGELLNLRDTGFSTERYPYIVFVRCGSVCSAGDAISYPPFDLVDGDLSQSDAVVVDNDSYQPVVTGGRLRLTEEGTLDTANAVWFAPDDLKAHSGFLMRFDVFLSHSVLGTGGDANPGEGMTFAVLEGDAGFAAGALGDPGGSLGFEGGSLRVQTDCHPGFAVEIDLVEGGGEPGNEPPGVGSPTNDGKYHVGIDVNASVTSNRTNQEFGVRALPDAFSSEGVRVEVIYRPDGQVLVWMTARDGSYPRRLVLTTRIPQLQGQLICGFTASTGAYSVTQEVADLQLFELCCDKSEVVVISGQDVAPVGKSVELSAVSKGGDPDRTTTNEWKVAAGGAVIERASPDAVIVTGIEPGEVVVEAVVSDGVCGAQSATKSIQILAPEAARGQIPGDCNQDAVFDAADTLCLLGHLLLGKPSRLPCKDAEPNATGVTELLDWDGSGALDITDAISGLTYFYLGGPSHFLGTECRVVVDCPEVCGS